MANSPLYLNKIQLQAELNRCLNCKTQPCMKACPVNCNPQEFINHAKQGNFDSAVKTITRNNPMGQTCGLICPDKFCMQACTRRNIDFSINIPKVQATILENYRKPDSFSPTPHRTEPKIAVIGAGPAGMAAASILNKNGISVTIFEKSDKIGGALKMIPASRLPDEVIEKDWNFLNPNNEIDLKLNTTIEKPLELLEQGFDGIIIASGEPNCTNLKIQGEEHCLSYMDYLSNPQKYQTDGKVAIIGGGNVAADCAFTAKASGSSHVEMFVRRRLADMRISKNEYLDLIQHEINITPLSSPEKIEANDNLLNLFMYKNSYNNNKLNPIPDSTIKLPDFALIVTAVGSYADPKIEDDRIIYAGDCKTGGSTIVEALASGQSAAMMMLERLGIKKTANS